MAVYLDVPSAVVTADTWVESMVGHWAKERVALTAVSTDETLVVVMAARSAVHSAEQKAGAMVATWDLPEADRWAVQMAADSVILMIAVMAASSAAATAVVTAGSMAATWDFPEAGGLAGRTADTTVETRAVSSVG
jgi:hypothetical protein